MSARREAREVAPEAAAALAWPGPDTVWRHKNGEFYRVVTTALIEHDHTPVVVYRRWPVSYFAWVRPITEFLDGRFTLQGGPEWPGKVEGQ